MKILRPCDVPGIGVRTPEAYRSFQRRMLSRLGRPEPFVSDAEIHAYVSGGAWRVRCACGEAPPADPSWRLACCSGCGAVYEAVVFPLDIDAIEADLLSLDASERHWTPPAIDAAATDSEKA